MPKNKSEWLAFIYKNLLIIIGTFLVAFGNVAFLVPLDINSGGLSGIGVIVRFFISDPGMKILAYNLVVDIASVVLWIVGFIFVGKEFALKTLLATIIFPLANWLLTACPGVSNSVSYFGELIKQVGNGPTAGNFVLASLFGGVFIGGGVALTFVGGGSTGGVDVITFLFEKYLRIRQSIASFIVVCSFSGHGGQTNESITTYSTVFPQHRPQPPHGDAGGSEHLRQGHPLPQG